MRISGKVKCGRLYESAGHRDPVGLPDPPLRHSPLLYLLLSLTLALGFAANAAAQESLDEVIGGFEEEKSFDTDGAMETVRQGFDDAAETQQPGDTSIDDVLEGFSEEPSAVDETASRKPTTSRVHLDGSVKLGAAWNFAHDPPEGGQTDWRGLSRLRPEIRMDLDADPAPGWKFTISAKCFHDAAYALKGRNTFTGQVLDAYETEAELTDTYIQGRLSRYLDLKAGRQIVVWGRSDNIRVTDVLNPLDGREPGTTDIEDLRLPVTMTRLDGYWAEWNLSAIAVHEIRFDKSPVFGHDFFPGDAPLPEDDKPRCGGRNTEWALALNGIFSGKDISFYWADLFNDRAHAAMDPTGKLRREHARITLYGAAGNLALGNWLLKSEAAYWRGLRFFNGRDETYERLDGLLGFEYSGWNETTVSVDWAVRRLLDFDDRLPSAPDDAQRDEFQWAFRATRDFMSETLTATFLAMIFGPLGQDGALERLTVSYDWTDALSTTCGIVFYQSGDQYILSGIDPNDRLFAEVRYSF